MTVETLNREIDARDLSGRNMGTALDKAIGRVGEIRLDGFRTRPQNQTFLGDGLGEESNREAARGQTASGLGTPRRLDIGLGGKSGRRSRPIVSNRRTRMTSGLSRW